MTHITITRRHKEAEMLSMHDDIARRRMAERRIERMPLVNDNAPREINLLRAAAGAVLFLGTFGLILVGLLVMGGR